MPKLPATVYWSEEKQKAKVHPNPITVKKSDGTTVIEWSLGDDVESFRISGLDAAEFTPAGSSGWVTSFATTDKNDDGKTHSYTVTARHPDGRTDSHDPKIQNGAG